MATQADIDKQQQMEADRMRKVLLLLDNLAQREEATVRGILESLYDIGSAHLIDAKIRHRCLNHALLKVAHCSRPAFRMLAVRWFQQNCPRLIANWLYTQAKFQEPQLTVAQQALAIAKPELLLPTEQPPQHVVVQEIQRLRRQVRQITMMSIGAIMVSGCLGLWLGHHVKWELVQLPWQTQTDRLPDTTEGVPVQFTNQP